MQDFNYVWYGCMEVTIEMSCCKYPPRAQLPKFWEQNRLVIRKKANKINFLQLYFYLLN